MSGSEKRNERTTWVCGKWGLTEVIEHWELYCTARAAPFCFGGRKSIESRKYSG